MGFDEYPPQQTATATTLIVSVPASAANRGFVALLGKANVNFNSVATTTIFTTPASGFTRCVVVKLVVDNATGTFNGTAIITAINFGIPLWSGGGTPPSIGVAGLLFFIYPAAFAAAITAGTATNFTLSINPAMGVAATADVAALGYYE